MMEAEESIFSEFVGELVKVAYTDGGQFKIARGKLEEIKGGFIKVTGTLGTIIIKESSINKMGRLKPR